MARHAALARVDCDWLALGHHRDDQAETVLFRLLRGAGVRGAVAMSAIEAAASGKPGRLRPLLEVDRETILAAARAENLGWVDDASNTDPRFTRNDLRHRILPVIETRFPAARVTLARAAAHFREAAVLLDELAEADALAARLECAEGEQGRVFARKILLGLSPARLANLFHRELRLRGTMPPPAARLAEAMRQLRTAPGPLVLPLGDCVCYSRRGRVWLMSVQGAGNVNAQ
jgi:tRNA(Ile)-lysidine synthase